MKNNSKNKDYPITLTFRFKTEGAKEEFVADLIEGRGENMADYSWLDGKSPYKTGTVIIRVDPIDPME